MNECMGQVTNPALYLLGAGVGVTIASLGYPVMWWLGKSGWTFSHGFSQPAQEGR